MSEQNKIQLFENQPIRTAWNEEQEEWYFSVVDVIHVLTGSENPRRYWSDLKRKLKSEGATQLYENIVQLKMKSSDGKNYRRCLHKNCRHQYGAGRFNVRRCRDRSKNFK